MKRIVVVGNGRIDGIGGGQSLFANSPKPELKSREFDVIVCGGGAAGCAAGGA